MFDYDDEFKKIDNLLHEIRDINEENLLMLDDEEDVDEQLNLPEFLSVNNTLVSENYENKNPTQLEVQKAINTLNLLTKYYNKEVISTLFQWGMLAPFHPIVRLEGKVQNLYIECPPGSMFNIITDLPGYLWRLSSYFIYTIYGENLEISKEELIKVQSHCKYPRKLQYSGVNTIKSFEKEHEKFLKKLNYEKITEDRLREYNESYAQRLSPSAEEAFKVPVNPHVQGSVLLATPIPLEDKKDVTYIKIHESERLTLKKVVEFKRTIDPLYKQNYDKLEEDLIFLNQEENPTEEMVKKAIKTIGMESEIHKKPLIYRHISDKIIKDNIEEIFIKEFDEEYMQKFNSLGGDLLSLGALGEEYVNWLNTKRGELEDHLNYTSLLEFMDCLYEKYDIKPIEWLNEPLRIDNNL